MCGIAGVLGAGLEPELTRITERLAHRGPDGNGAFHDREQGLHLGHTRLSILDHEGGAQPMSTADGGLTVVFNGEIYNHADLRRTLEQLGHRFRSDHSDTEVLLHGYREWGGGLCERLNGMWAFAIYDRSCRRLFLSRDRFGQKPLYYHCAEGMFVFASELSALLACRAVPGDLSVCGLQKYFAYGFVPAPHTFYQSVQKLPAGCSLTLDLGTCRCALSCYWDFVPEPGDPPDRREAQLLGEELLARLEAAVRRRLTADVPVGVFLSGGIDSSTVTALAAKAAPVGKLSTFSIGFEEASFDETPYFELASRHIGTDHHSATVSLEDMRRDLTVIASHVDEPTADSSFLPTYRLCGETRRHVTVALGGDGADELLAGYDPFRALRWAARYRRFVPGGVHTAVRLAVSLFPESARNMGMVFRAKRTLRGLSYPPAMWNPVWLSPLEPQDIVELLGTPCDPENVYEEAIGAWEGCAAQDPVSRTSCFFVKLYLQDDTLAKIDRASMAHSLEVRSPFLDIELVDFLRRLPIEMKLGRGVTKVLLRQAAARLLPAPIVNRPKKGFGLPLESWLRRWSFELEDLPAVLNRDAVARYIDRHRRGRANEKFVLWELLLLNQHMRLRRQ
jgi:asparagine synthase (glutamine-hydrolysing)